MESQAEFWFLKILQARYIIHTLEQTNHIRDILKIIKPIF
jgi:hypothetical protein